MQYRTTCLTESIKLQKKIIAAEKNLFSLNPLSTALQVKYDLTLTEILAALTISNYPLAAKLKADLIKIQTDQSRLDHAQKTIIATARLAISAETLQIEKVLKAQSLQLSQKWSFFLLSFFTVRPSHFAQMSVQAKTSGIAPNYELKDNYKQNQAVAFVWQMKYFTKTEQQQLVKSKNNFEMSCEAKPSQSEDRWSIEI